MRLPTSVSSFSPGDVVRCGDKLDITGIVERVIFARGMMEPLILVEFWHEGDRRTMEFHHADVRAA